MKPREHEISSRLSSEYTPARLASLIMSAQENERARIARDLHDDICQQLSVLAGDLADLRGRLSGSERTRLDAALLRVNRINSDIHSVSHRLHPSIVRDLGLKSAVESECRQFRDRHGVPVRLTARAAIGEVTEHNALALFRILEEALQNIAKHARASEVHVSLHRSVNHVHLRVEDSGLGFDPDQVAFGLGLTSMRERIALARGYLSIRSVPGQGTRLIAIVPAGPLSKTRRIT
jgi:signal transduction histidine kinase